ncbi:MAG TPA: ion channel [Burkholderiales bacterium]|nr:ion channel [Burkholderiales bacterium]
MSSAIYNNWAANIAVVLATIFAVIAAAFTHYEGLAWINRTLAHVGHPRRRSVLYAVLSLIALHIAEIWIFAIAYYALLLWSDTGHLNGANGNIFEYVYYSATVFTTLGVGDILPTGPIRFLTGTEALTGFVLIGWSASFTYLKMEHLWKPR